MCDYLAKLTGLSAAARWYLLHAALLTGALGVGALFYNLAIDALGYERIFLGQLETAARIAALLLLLPLWWLVHRVGLRQALIVSAALQACSALILAARPETLPLLVASAVTGPAAVLFQVSAAPLMMAHSRADDRDYLFSANAALNIGVAGLSKWLGGMLPALFAAPLGVAIDHPLAYRATFGIVGLILLCSIIPLLRIPSRPDVQHSNDPAPGVTGPIGTNEPRHFWGRRYVVALAQRLPEPWRSAAVEPGPLIALLTPPALVSLGAALLIPYLNLFLRERHAATGSQLGAILAAGDIIAGAAMLAAPRFAARWGKVRTIAFAQLLSIPFLLIAGFAADLTLTGAALILRAGLFNMGVPLYDALAMERSRPAARPVVIGLVNGAYASGYLIAPLISTTVQQVYGFAPLFAATACCYILAALTIERLLREQKKIDKSVAVV